MEGEFLATDVIKATASTLKLTSEILGSTSLPYSLTHLLTYSLTYSLTYLLTHSLKVNSMVEVNYKGYGRWYQGRVSQINADGTYDVVRTHSLTYLLLTYWLTH